MITQRGRVRHASTGRLTQWRHAIGWTARSTMTTQPWRGPLEVALAFQVATPATRPPDLDKLTRAVLDALTGIVWDDDAQVVALAVTKRRSATPGLMVTVTPVEEE